MVSRFTLLGTFRGNASDLADLFLPKDARIVMTTFGTLTYQFFASVQCEKVPMHLSLKHLPPIQSKATIISLTYCELYIWTQIDRADQQHPFGCCSPQKISLLVHQLVS